MEEEEIDINELVQQVAEILKAEASALSGLEEAISIVGLELAPVIEYVNGSPVSKKIAVSRLVGPIGKTPILTLKVEATEYGSEPKVEKSGTDENPHFTIKFPAGKNGETPVPMKTEDGIGYKYEGEDDSAFHLLIPITELKLKFSDLTSEDIAFLQLPAKDATQAAIQATLDANTAKDAAMQAAIVAAAEAEQANDAAENANTKATAAIQATLDANTAKEAATQAAIVAEAKAERANDAAENANTKATEAANEAIRAKKISDYPPKIEGGTWRVYDSVSQDYKDTGLPARGAEGKPLQVNEKGNYKYWDEDLQDYVDSGIPAAAMVDIENVSVNFTIATSRNNLESGENVPTIFGKIAKWFSDFGALAWKSKVDYNTEVDNRPTALKNPASITFTGGVTGGYDGSSAKTVAIPSKLSELANDTGYQTSEQVAMKIAKVVNGSPEALDTLLELAEALGNDPNFAATMTEALGKKVNKEEGKSLVSDTLINKLTNLRQPKTTSVTSLPSNWVQVGDTFTYNVYDTDIIDGCYVSVDIDSDSYEVAVEAELSPSNPEFTVGRFTIKAKKQPASNINFTYTIF